MKQSLLLSVFVALCVSCSKPIPELTGIDLTIWKNDLRGCSGNREKYVEDLRIQRDKLKGLSERDLVKLLGSPDQTDLSEHHEKFYYYFITPAGDCVKGDSALTSLVVRFNATGVSKEVTIDQKTLK